MQAVREQGGQEHGPHRRRGGEVQADARGGEARPGEGGEGPRLFPRSLQAVLPEAKVGQCHRWGAIFFWGGGDNLSFFFKSFLLNIFSISILYKAVHS